MRGVNGIALVRADSRIGAWAQRVVPVMTPRGPSSHSMNDIGPMRDEHPTAGLITTANATPRTVFEAFSEPRLWALFHGGQ
jgi:hypothetical protein